MWSPTVEPTTGPILLAIEAVPQAQALVAAAAKLARQSHAEVLVLSVRERDFVRGYGWDVHQPGEIAETVSHAIYELGRAGVRAPGLLPTAPARRVRDEIIYAAPKHHADELVIRPSRRPWPGWRGRGNAPAPGP